MATILSRPQCIKLYMNQTVPLPAVVTPGDTVAPVENASTMEE